MTRSHGTKLNMKVSKLHIGTSKTMHLPLFWKSHCATCSPVYVILYHVTGSCKGSIAFTKSNAILYNYIHITQLPSTRHVYALADLFFRMSGESKNLEAARRVSFLFPICLGRSKETLLAGYILTKYFADRLTAVDVFYSIHKAAIFNAEQLILGITASR